MDIHAVFFDLDDTLVVFDGVSESSWREVCAAYCAGRPGLDPEVIYGRIRERSSRFWSDPERFRIGRLDIVTARKAIVREVFSDLGLSERDAEEVALHFSRLRLENMYLVPGARDTLDALRSRGCKMALLTNGDSETQRWKIRRFDLGDYFQAVLIEGELGFGKPDPRVYRRALSVLGVSARNTIMAGDNPEWDVKAPQREGIRAAWICRRGKEGLLDPEIAPDWTIGSVAELPGCLDGLL